MQDRPYAKHSHVTNRTKASLPPCSLWTGDKSRRVMAPLAVGPAHSSANVGDKEESLHSLLIAAFAVDCGFMQTCAHSSLSKRPRLPSDSELGADP